MSGCTYSIELEIVIFLRGSSSVRRRRGLIYGMENGMEEEERVKLFSIG
jgi:hypothetical protein